MSGVLVCPSEDVKDMALALGLDPSKVLALTMRVRPGCLVTVHVHMVLSPEQGMAIATKWRRFALMPLLDEKK